MALGTEMLKWGSDWFEDVGNTANRVSVVYSRPSTAQSVTVYAQVGKTEFWGRDGEGFTVKVELRSFKILRSDLLLGGSAATPTRGDTIAETRSGTTYTYEVAAPDGKRVDETDDAFRKAWKVPTVQIS